MFVSNSIIAGLKIVYHSGLISKWYLSDTLQLFSYSFLNPVSSKATPPSVTPEISVAVANDTSVSPFPASVTTNEATYLSASSLNPAVASADNASINPGTD